MSDDERDLNTEPVIPPTESADPDDDLRFAPPGLRALKTDAISTVDAGPVLPPPDSDLALSMTDGLDIEAALAAVSTLSDMVAEAEAAEQARVAEAEAAEQARQERQARLEHPEMFFPVPPLTSVRRASPESALPALLLMAFGGILTFSLTTGVSIDPIFLLMAGVGALVVILLVHWLSSGRWARGSLFIGLSLLLVGMTVLILLQPGMPGLIVGWPMLVSAVGLAMMMSVPLSRPSIQYLAFAGFVLIVAGLVGLVVTLGLLSPTLLTTMAGWWPGVLAVLVVLALLPVLFRQRE